MRNIGIAPTATIVALALAGCGSRAQIQTITSQTTASTTTAVQEPALQVSGHATQHKAKRKRAATGLAVSNASNDTVQSQPSPGSCHARGSGLYSLPDPNCTPGALNPVVTQVTIDQTICVTGWTKTVRPSADITQQEKAASMAAYGVGGPMSDYEYDHLVSLALGGATNDSRNLWPEPGATPNPKDSVENALRRRVCARSMTLAQAQHIIATDWVSWAHGSTTSTSASATQSTPAPAPVPTPAPTQTSSVPVVHPGAWCGPEKAHGVTDRGTPMTCSAEGTDTARWRRSQ